MQADGIGGKPRVASWRRGANADLPLGPGLGKSLGFTLAADGQEGMLCSPDNHPIALGASHLGQDRAATGWRSSS